MEKQCPVCRENFTSQNCDSSPTAETCPTCLQNDFVYFCNYGGPPYIHDYKLDKMFFKIEDAFTHTSYYDEESERDEDLKKGFTHQGYNADCSVPAYLTTLAAILSRAE